MINSIYLYLLSPLHTGGATQEGNLLGIARESHTNLPYIPSSTIRGRLRASVADRGKRFKLFGTDLKESQQLEQGDIWIGDASILWLPVPSLSHSVIWISCPMLLRRWLNLNGNISVLPDEYSCNFIKGKSNIYLKDAILKADQLKPWQDWKKFVPQTPESSAINRVLILPDQHCATLIQMSLWRQVKIKLDEHKSVEGGFRYEEAIPPDTLMYFSWGTTSQANGSAQQSSADFKALLAENQILQIGGQESLGRGFVQQWLAAH
ncbi:type III-B CRISPR module RAMP protein Cmr4 [Chlorogloeopsis fritschii PCC 9212]|uniref:Type III-B CRISPR module RAMP protein Cmr4 n=1 Tax=Chlorogloeopsis fritschii PCC 6912 TaxID=211165 RepID=A0A3S0YFF9_CHLFR|nr:type III-B CRISPR module RAMP protein Cmr4 [Chlorogloeopsis fritschii]RUR83493.1 type III-B CRISPR module RAMP protein Cmr4 [Chlorogloeopsis fritschii PCC 6912]